jgi:flagellar biosynthetic protein FliQ
MDTARVLEIGNDFLYTVMLLALPSLVVSLAVGLVISIFQTVTSIQEQTLAFAPRLIAVGVVIAFTMSWSLQIAVHFTTRMLMVAAEVTR